MWIQKVDLDSVQQDSHQIDANNIKSVVTGSLIAMPFTSSPIESWRHFLVF